MEITKTMTTGTQVLQIVAAYANSVKNILFGLDNVILFEAISVLDMFIAIMLFDLIIWFIIRLIKGKEENENIYGDNDERLQIRD